MAEQVKLPKGFRLVTPEEELQLPPGFTLKEEPGAEISVDPSLSMPALERAKLSFASSEDVVRKTLEKQYGPANVRITEGDKIIYRPSATEGWRYYNKPGMDMNDLAGLAGIVPDILGGTAGALLGAAAGPPGAVGGAALGTGLGRTLKRTASMSMGNVEPTGFMPAAMDVSGAIVEGAAGETIGRGITNLAQKVATPFASKVTREGMAADAFLKREIPAGSLAARQAGLKQGAFLPPAQMTESRMVDLMHNVAEGSIFGGGFIRNFIRNTEKVLTAKADEWASAFGANLSDAELGQAIVDSNRGLLQASNEFPSHLYQWLDDVLAPKITRTMTDIGPKSIRTGGMMVNIKPLKRMAEPLQLIARESGNIGTDVQGFDVASDIMSLPDVVPYDTAKMLRTSFIKSGGKLKLALGTEKAPVFKLLSDATKTLHNQVASALRQYDKVNDTPFYNQWHAANAIWEKNKELFDNRFIRGLIKTADLKFGRDPAKVLSKIFTPGAGAKVADLQRAVDVPTWGKIQNWFAKTLIDNSIDPKTGVLRGQQLLTQMKNYGDEAIDGVFGESAPWVKEFAKSLDILQRPQLEGTGRMLIQLTQGGAIISAASFSLTGTAGTVLLAPAAMAKLMTTKQGARWLSAGLKLPASSPSAAGLATRLMILMDQQEKVQKVIDEAEARGEDPPDKLKIARVTKQELLGKFGGPQQGQTAQTPEYQFDPTSRRLVPQ